MNLLKKYGALVMRSRAIALVHECYKKCCKRWVCAYLDGGLPSERQCYEEGTDDLTVISTHETEEECRQKCESWVCSWVDSENDAGKDCYPTGMQPYPSPQDVEYDSESECRQFCVPWVCAWSSPTDDPADGKDCYPKGMEPGTVISEHDTEQECKDACYEGWVCAYKSSDPLKGRDCYADPGLLDPELIVLSEHDTEKECRELCIEDWVCAYKSIDPTKDRECFKDSSLDPELVILSEHSNEQDCKAKCVEDWVCAYYDSETPDDRACYENLDPTDPTIIVLSEHANEAECKAACVAEWSCAYRSIDPDKGKACYENASDDPELIVVGTYDTKQACEEYCDVWVCAYSASAPDSGRACSEKTDDPDQIVLSEHGTEEECQQQCYDDGYGCVISSMGEYECLDVRAIPNLGDVLSFHDTLSECEAACEPEVGACCIKDCVGCPREDCQQVWSYWDKQGDTCVEVFKTTSDNDEVWASDACNVWKTAALDSVDITTLIATCGSNAPDIPYVKWTRVGDGKKKCEDDGIWNLAECYDGLTEKECIDKAGGKEYEWSSGEKCADVTCSCGGYECARGSSSGGGFEWECIRTDTGSPQYATLEECEQWCPLSVCSYYYTGEYDCVSYDPEVHDVSNAVEGEYCERTCCEDCAVCHSKHNAITEFQVGRDTCTEYSGLPFPPDPPEVGVTTGGEFGGGLRAGSAPFAPCASPFREAGFASVEQRFRDIDGDRWYLERTDIPQTIDDCNGDGCDCNWADYDRALKYEREGYKVYLWSDYRSYTRSSGGGIGPSYDTGFLWTHRYRFRAFTYSCDEGWKDRTDTLLKRSVLEYYYLLVGGPTAVEHDIEYKEPIKPDLLCTNDPPAPGENPFP